MKEVQEPSFREYVVQLKANAKALAASLKELVWSPCLYRTNLRATLLSLMAQTTIFSFGISEILV